MRRNLLRVKVSVLVDTRVALVLLRAQRGGLLEHKGIDTRERVRGSRKMHVVVFFFLTD